MTNSINDNGTASRNSPPAVSNSPQLDEETIRYVGQMIVVIFDGYNVTPEIKMMIEKYHVGNIMLTARNIRDRRQVANLTQELQKIAHTARFHFPLMIGIEQENGMISRFGDGVQATHFPGPMAIAATRSANHAFDIAKATARELVSVGINWNFAPVLDVVSEQCNPTVSVRAFGDDPEMVGQFGVAFAEGLRAGRVGHCAKHFPGAAFSRDAAHHLAQRKLKQDSKKDGEFPELELLPFRKAVNLGLDSVMLSSSIWPQNESGGDGNTSTTKAEYIIRDVLRSHLGYNGVTVCDATDMPIFASDSRKIGEAVVVAVVAGCDLVRIYHNATVQVQGIQAIYEAIQSNRIQRNAIYKSSSLISQLKEHYFNWRTALADPDPERLGSLMQQHQIIARKGYEDSTTVVRDDRGFLPLVSTITPSDEVLLLTPIIRPLYRHPLDEKPIDPFECLGRALSRRHPRIIHAPYTSHGLLQAHIPLIKRCSAIVFVTANAIRPRMSTQAETAVAVHRLCDKHKPMINLSVCDPYDLLEDKTFGTYICTYEYSVGALEAAASVVFGERHAVGVLPIKVPGATALRQQRHVNLY